SGQAIADTIAGKSNSTVDSDNLGPQFKFFVGTVLKSGVPGTTRTAFEADVAKLPAGNVSASAAADLAKKYPGVANAYSPDQWTKAFGARGMDKKAFGSIY